MWTENPKYLTSTEDVAGCHSDVEMLKHFHDLTFDFLRLDVETASGRYLRSQLQSIQKSCISSKSAFNVIIAYTEIVLGWDHLYIVGTGQTRVQRATPNPITLDACIGGLARIPTAASTFGSISHTMGIWC